MQLRDIHDVDRKLIQDILAIDELVYASDFRGTYEEVSERFRANRDMFILLYDDDKIIGYLCLFPIKAELYEKIVRSDRMYDSDIPGSMIERYTPGERYKLFMISVAIHPDYQNQGHSGKIIQGFYSYMLKKQKDNIHIDSILAISVSKPGERFLGKLRFAPLKEIKSGISLHELIIDETFYSMAAGETDGTI
ncbi:GNAT family N-acetyltransferase [Paenibacillus sp. YIM B09110]|uniref:GNAT family N-acetyltransferase n=1 Tax=Paenibacillus sp. YIM B09110 TaxID=3126102 RepID=UPI00301CDA2E